MIEVLEAPGLVTVQDAGRPGLAHLGVPRAGWLDPSAGRLANRLVGNSEDAAVLETTAGGVRLRLTEARWVAVTGAVCAVDVGGRARGHSRPEWVATGDELVVGPATRGLRSYVAFGGGVGVEPVLGSRSSDTLAGVGPPRVDAGAVLPLGPAVGAPALVDIATAIGGGGGPALLRVDPGPRADWCGPDALARLCATSWSVTAESNRIGVRLDGEPLPRERDDELPSEGMVLGAVQVPPSGLPVVFLADHPTTGGYPVLAVVRADDLAPCAQLRPGDEVRFTSAN